MGTKNDPGKFDCYSKAEPDEPMFVLLGRDPAAPIVINLWADIRSRMGEEQAKVEEAHDCSERCCLWLERLGKHGAYIQALEIAQDDLKREDDLIKINQLKELVRQLVTKLPVGTNEELRLVAADLLEGT